MRFTFVSSDHSTFRHCFPFSGQVQSKWSFTNFSRAFTCFGVSIETFRELLPPSPCSTSHCPGTHGQAQFVPDLFRGLKGIFLGGSRYGRVTIRGRFSWASSRFGFFAVVAGIKHEGFGLSQVLCDFALATACLGHLADDHSLCFRAIISATHFSLTVTRIRELNLAYFFFT